MATNKHREDVAITIRSPKATIVRSRIVGRESYLEHREVLRWDFWFSCAYCSIAETEAAGIRFTIDHYLPQVRYAELIDDYHNLMWSCEHCNSRKKEAPTEPAARKGYRFFRADYDDPDEHFALESESNPRRIKPKTELVGKYTVEHLDLNRKNLVRLREIRARMHKSTEVLLKGLNSLRELRLDELPLHTRAMYHQTRERLLADGASADSIADETVLREANRSQYVDPPPKSDHNARERRKYLRKVNAAVPLKPKPKTKPTPPQP